MWTGDLLVLYLLPDISVEGSALSGTPHPATRLMFIKKLDQSAHTEDLGE